MLTLLLFIVRNFFYNKSKSLAFLTLSLFGLKSFNDAWRWVEISRHFQYPCFLRTVYFNFRVLPFKQAIHCPIYIYNGCQFLNLHGNVILKCAPKPGCIRWGYDWGFRGRGRTRIRIEGVVIIGDNCDILVGSNIAVFKNAVLSFGKDCLICEDVMIYCQEMISFGDSLCLTYECNVYDSDFHYSYSIGPNIIKKKTEPIRIGNYVWIGNRASIKKGVIIPDYVTVAASGSLLTKDYSDLVPKFGVLGGSPAKVLSVSICRTWKNEQTHIDKLDAWFFSHQERDYELSPDEKVEDYTGIIIS